MRNMLRRLKYLVRRNRFEADLREEMELHRSLATGRFGNATLAREDARAVWTFAGIERLLQDVRYGMRSLRKGRAFTIVAASTLALGIGASAIMFGIVNGVLLRPLPYSDAPRVAMLWTIDEARGLREAGTSFPTFSDWRAQSHSFSDMAIWRGIAGNVNGADSTERVPGALVSPNLFAVLGVSARLGRTISADDESRRALVTVVSHRFWQRRFGGAPDVVGKTLDIDGRTFEIIGVMPDGFYFPTKDVKFWCPSRLYGVGQLKPLLAERTWSNRYNDLWRVVGRLRPGVSVRDAQADMRAIGRRLAAAYPSPSPDFVGFDVEVVPMLTQVTGRDLEFALWMLMGAVGFVLLVACANVANLLLARGAAREREFAVRAALGASRLRLLRQLAIENALLAAGAGAIGVGITAAGIRLLSGKAPALLPRLDEVSLDWRVVAFTAAVSLLASVTFGTVPAWRLSSGNAADSLKQSGAATGGVSARRTRRALVVVECALAVILLAGAGLLIRSLAIVRSVDPGVDVSHVLLVRVNLPLPMSPQWRRQEWSTFQQMEERIAQIPGVTHVGMIQNFLNPANPEEALTIESAQGATGDTLVTVTDTTPGFFQAMGVPLIAGRFFSAQEQNSLVAIVNQAFVKRFFGDGNPVGKRFHEGSDTAHWYTIVGVVGDMRRQGLERDPLPEYYYCSSEPTMDVAVRTAGNPAALAAAVRQALRDVYPNTVVLSSATVEATLGELGAQRSFQTSVLSTFAAVALVLAGIGIYGIVHFAVAQRRQEIGIRLALGASSGDIARLIVSQGMTLPIAGTVLGLIGAVSLTRVMRHLLFRVSPVDPATLTAVAAVLLAVAFAACWLPARRAMQTDPLESLRHE